MGHRPPFRNDARVWLDQQRPRLAKSSAARDEGWGTGSVSTAVFHDLTYRIAGGTDEFQRNIIGERVLGLPR